MTGATLALLLLVLGGPAHAGSLPQLPLESLTDRAVDQWDRIENRRRLDELERRQQEEDDQKAVEWMRRLEDDSPRDPDQ